MSVALSTTSYGRDGGVVDEAQGQQDGVQLGGRGGGADMVERMMCTLLEDRRRHEMEIAIALAEVLLWGFVRLQKGK